jgi:hypothetical protein
MKSQRLDSGRNRALINKGSIQKRVPKISRRAKAIGMHKKILRRKSKSLDPMAPPWELKKGDKDKLSTAMEL